MTQRFSMSYSKCKQKWNIFEMSLRVPYIAIYWIYSHNYCVFGVKLNDIKEILSSGSKSKATSLTDRLP